MVVEEGSSSSDLPYVDDFYFSALHDEEEIFPISDEKYAEELQLQEALMSSAISSRIFKDESYSLEMKNLSIKKQKVVDNRGESSSSFCVICMDAKPTGEMFRNNATTCSHSFCADCIAKHVAAKIQENITLVKCPDLKCKGVIEPELCRPIIPQEVFERWENALCESLILGSQKFYCPFKDCAAMLVDDGGEFVTVSECPNCRRLFCAQCKVSWHGEIDCMEFQRLNNDERESEDIMLMKLAKNNKWRRCSHCKFYVEKVSGCLHIACRCGYQFCYGCGGQWTKTHACQQT